MPVAMPNAQNSARHGDIFETSPNPENGEVSNIAFPSSNPQKAGGSFEWHGSCHITRARSGVAAHFACNTGRGGARNRADRASHALTMAQIVNLRAAERHADIIGLPLTRMVSIHWEAAGVPLEDMAKVTGRFTDLLTKALARHGGRTAWLWVHENGEGKGGHCHMLVHVPAELVPVVTALQRRWLKSITGRPYRSGVIHSKPIGGRLGLEAGNPDLHAVNLEAALSYVLKGATIEAASQFGMVRRESGGRIVGKRCGTSQNIGAKARKVWGLARQL